MTKSQIKAELRREANENYPLFSLLSLKAYDEVWSFLDKNKLYDWSGDGHTKRTFILLVAEAL